MFLWYALRIQFFHIMQIAREKRADDADNHEREPCNELGTLQGSRGNPGGPVTRKKQEQKEYIFERPAVYFFPVTHEPPVKE